MTPNHAAAADVLDTVLRACRLISTVEIVEDTGRDRQEVHNALRYLERRGVIERVGTRKSGGRPTALWAPRPRRAP